jgi:hypothetical protein
MRRHVLGSALVLGSLLVGCGVRPAALPSAPIVPVQTSAQAAKGNFSVKDVLMPPMAVFQTVEAQNKQFAAWMKTSGGAKWVSTSPVMNTVQFTVAGEKVGYFVSVHGNAVIAKDGQTESYKAFLNGYLIDTKGQLAFSYGLGAGSKADQKKPEQPSRTFSKKFGDLQLRMPQGEKLPPAIQAKLDALHLAEQATIAGKFPASLTMLPTDASWWNFGACEVWYKDTMVGYWNDPAAWMWQQDDAAMVCKYGFMALNILDPAGNRLYGKAQAIEPTNIMGYKSFNL